MDKKIVFRADGNKDIGLGHMYRLLALFKIYSEKYECCFVTKTTSNTEFIPNEYKIVLIPENVEVENEPELLKKKFNPSEYIVIADGYFFNSIYQKKIKDFGYNLIYVDDMATEYMYADIVVNHSPYVTQNNFKCEPYTKFALGLDYAILRLSFYEQNKNNIQIGKISQIFLCFGGADFHDLTYKVASEIKNIREIDRIHVVLGGAYKHEKIIALHRHNESKISLYRNLSEKNMISLMRKCQLAIVPSSTIAFEVCSIPIIVFSGYFIDNQRNIYNGLKKEEVIYDGADFTKYGEGDFYDAIQKIIKTPMSQHKQKIDRLKKSFDGQQPKRFMNLLQELKQ